MNSVKPTNLDTPIGAPTTVLVAEDDPVTRLSLKRFLAQQGHTVLDAADGEQAWSLFASRRPRLVVTDWRMPKLDGIGLCERIRAMPADHYTFVLILTSTTDHEAMEQAFAAGADDFMTKPFNRAELAWRIHSGMRVLDLQSTLASRIEELDRAGSELRKANDAMQAGLQAAAKAQQAMLPQSAPEVREVRCAWTYQPSDHLGGDSLNLFALDEHQLGFFIADVCGHGLSSALLAVALHRVLTPAAGQQGLLCSGAEDAEQFFADPGRVLTHVNRRFPMDIERGEYFTSVYGVIDTQDGELRYAGAGHPSPVIRRPNGSVVRLATDGFPIGFDDSVDYETQRIPFHPGDRLCVYSDGVLEAANASGEMYGLDRLIANLNATENLSVQGAISDLVSQRAAWEAGQADDVSIILIDFAAKTARDSSEPAELRNHMAPTPPIEL